MPGMDMGSRSGSVLLGLAELALFWTATLVHVLRLLSPTRLPDTDRPADAGHAVMGAGMTLMVFPGVSVGTLRAAAACYAAWPPPTSLVPHCAEARRSTAASTRRSAPGRARWPTCSPPPRIRRRGYR